MRVYEWECVTKEGQTSFIRPANMPDIPDAARVSVYYDGRKLPGYCYDVQCHGALVVVRGEWPEGLDLVIRYEVSDDA